MKTTIRVALIGLAFIDLITTVIYLGSLHGTEHCEYNRRRIDQIYDEKNMYVAKYPGLEGRKAKTKK